MNSVVAGVDIGGSHITAALINMDERRIIEGTLIREMVDASGSAEIITEKWLQVIKKCFGIKGISPGKLGFAMPGPFDYDQGISYMKEQGKFRSLYGVNVRAILAEGLDIPGEHVLFSNDAACFLQGELFSGVGRGFKNSIGLTLGTGFGSAWSSFGIATDADLWRSPFQGAIAEDHFSTAGLVKAYRELSNRDVGNAKELTRLVGHDPMADLVFRQFGSRLGEFLEPLVRERESEIVIFGGNISRAFKHFCSSVRQSLPTLTVALEESRLWENAALLGAASQFIYPQISLEI